MNKKEALVAAEMLERYSDKLGNNTCNDWNFPEDWNIIERTDFVFEQHQSNGDIEEFNPNHLHLPDFCVASLLAKKLRIMAGE